MIADSTAWLLEAARLHHPRAVNLPVLGSLDWSSTAGVAPWRIGYERARRFRLLLDLSVTEPAPIDELVTVHQTGSPAPVNIDGLINAEGSAALDVVVGSGGSAKATRFAAARAIGRHSLAPIGGKSLLTRATQYTERTERAFAAELLAPANGIEELLAGDFSDDAIQRAAEHFNVNAILVQHQFDNQIAA
jgi:hypothetical protein